MNKNPNIKNYFGSTPLHIASIEGYLDIVKYLIEECKAEPIVFSKTYEFFKN